MANSTPDTPDVSETKLAALKMDELRAHARKLGIDGADELHKPELLAKVKDYHYAQAHGGKHRDGSGAGSSTDGRPSASELSSMKLGELREHARKHGIDGADELHKPELLAKVKDHHAADSQPSATELSNMKLGELREHARKHGIDGADELHKPELLAKVKDYHYAQAHGGKDRDGSGSGSPTTSHRSASELSSMKLGELREHARKLGIDGADELHKPELLAKVKDHHDTNSGGRGATAAKTNRGGNSTPDTPEVSETKLAALKMDELRSHARKLGIDGADELHKPELLAKVKDHHYAQAHGGKHRPDSGSGSTGGAGGPSPVKEDRGGHSTPDTQEASKTALGTASTDTPQDRPSSPALPSPALPSPALHSSEVDEADEPAQPELHATVADAPNPTEDEHLFPLKEKRPDLDHTAATTQAVTETAETAETAETTGTDDEGHVIAESTNDALTLPPGRLDVGTEARESGPARLPERVGSGHQQVTAPESIEEVDVDREPTTESIHGVADDDQAIFVKQPERVRPEVMLPEELSVVDPTAVLKDRNVLDTRIRTAPQGEPDVQEARPRHGG